MKRRPDVPTRCATWRELYIDSQSILPGTSLKAQSEPQAAQLVRGGCGAPTVWTMERYRFVLNVRDIGEAILRDAGALEITDQSALEAGLRHHNKRTNLSEPPNVIKTKALRYANRLPEAREALGKLFQTGENARIPSAVTPPQPWDDSKRQSPS